jgi:hypothetical protein
MPKRSKTSLTVSRKRRGKALGRASLALSTVMTAGIVLAPTDADAALTSGSEQIAQEAAVAETSSADLREFLRLHPKSEMAKQAFVQLAALCGGGSSEGRDPDCTGSVAADPASDPPDDEETNGGGTIY